MSEKKSYLKQINILFLTLSLLLFFTSWALQEESTVKGLLITEYGFVFFVPILFFIYFDIPASNLLSFDSVEGKDFLEVLGIILLAYPVLLLLHGIFGISFRETVSAVPFPQQNDSLFYKIFLLSITPAFCEELLFRGIFLEIYRPYGKECCIFINALFFGIFHRYFFQFPHAFALGVILAWIAWKKRNIVLAMWGHFLYNTLGLIVNYRIGGKERDFSYLSHMRSLDMVVIIIMGLFLAIGASVVLWKWQKPRWNFKNGINALRKISMNEMWPLTATLLIYLAINIF